MLDDDTQLELAHCHSDGGIATLEFLIRTPAAMVEATEQELVDELDPDELEAHIVCVALRRWQARAAEDLALIERLADADFEISYHAETDSYLQRDGSISVTASMWFRTIDSADATLQAMGATCKWASYSPVDTTIENDTSFLVGIAES